MTEDTLLSNLKDIHMPPEVPFWPPAFGWWILLFLSILIAYILSFWLWHSYKLRRPKIEALRILEDIQNQYNLTNDIILTLVRLSKLMRRVAITFYENEEVASLHGLAWLEFLDKTGKTDDFTKGVGKILGTGIYMKEPSFEIDSLFSIVKKWMVESSYNNLKNE